jgi:1-acyl-sn-glycerol-3-phosphate acyltransferase
MASSLHRPFRIAGRLAAFVAINGTGILDHLWNLRRRGLGRDPVACARWLHRWSTATLNGIGITCEHLGRPPTQGLLVSSHLGYLDIPVLASAGPMIFVSKAEVANWPFLGSLARCAGTLFLRREQRSHVAQIADTFRPIVQSGTLIGLFPEGTSSGGDTILPFRPSLLEPAAANDWPVTPAWIQYLLEPGDGTVAEHVAYWRDMTFAPHFLGLLARRRIRARVHYGTPISGIADRKELARRLHAAVSDLQARARGRPILTDL